MEISGVVNILFCFMFLIFTVSFLSYFLWAFIVGFNGKIVYKIKVNKIPKNINPVTRDSQRKVNEYRNKRRNYYKDELKANTIVSLIPLFNVYVSILIIQKKISKNKS